MALSNSQWLANPDTGYEIDQSIRFNDDDSAYLSRTPGSAGNRRTFTFSCWVKRANITGANGPIFTAGPDDWLQFLSGNTLGFNSDGTNNYRIVTTQLFRDPGAWMHVVLRIDTTNATAGDRERLYINGSEVTDFGTDTNPPLNYDTAFNNTGEHSIGKVVGSSQYFDGYLAEINHIDGSSLAPSNFGETNEDTGQWVPKEYSGSYGTNGFYIDGRDSSDLGDDESGNGNDYASNNLAAADQVTDSPTNNHCTLNPLWIDAHTLSDGNLVASAAADSAAIGTMAFDVTDSDGYYFEAKVTTAATYPNVGIRTVESPSQVGAVANLSGNSTGRYAFTGSDGNFNDAGSGSSYGSAWAGTADKVIGVLVKDGALYFSIDGTVQNSGTAAKTGLTGYMLPTVFYDAGSGTTAAWEMRFDASDWSTTPTGYKAITTSNLADPTIAVPTAYFETLIYSGNGASNRDITGLDFDPNLVWLKARNVADHNQIYDNVRTDTNRLSTNTTSAEGDSSADFKGFVTGGFRVNAVGSVINTNDSGSTQCAWNWKAESAWSESATGNILASSGKRNTTAGFSICSWTHQTSGNYAIKHGLSTTPEFFMTKNRESTANWDTWHKDLTDTAKRILINTNTTEITAYWVDASDSADGTGSYGDIGSGESPVTASLFGFQHDNFSATDDIIGYFWHGVEGYSKFGKFTGTGSATAGPVINLGFRPAVVLLKNNTQSYGWQIRDNKRDPDNVGTHALFPHILDVEATSSDNIDFLSNGFRIVDSGATFNASGNSILYMAWAESPFKTSTAR